ncbi:hypothetical protein F2Q68_00033560 [Brassica cretica]|uniref:Retrotransposon gag domain-containing protein n=2 Tax=Brassica cretica TaxID=69181 RepID=A0A8S9H8H5_BRACR|nr:hypothetical protein F2Q68_00033560 [Brassica cretica]
MKFSFPSIKAYDGTTDPDDHVAQYRQRMLAVALPKGSREATMCKRFGSTLTGLTLQWYINLPSRRSKGEKTKGAQTYDVEDSESEPEPDKEAPKGAAKTESPMVAYLEQMFSKRLDAMLYRTERDEKPSPRPARDSGNRIRGRYQNQPIEKAEGMAVSTWPDNSHLSISRPELINVLRQMGQQVKGPTSFRNPGLWCDFNHDHGHKAEDCVALRIEVKKFLKKGHLREFLSKKAKSHLSKETTGKPTEAAPVSPPRQNRVIHVISGGLEISDYFEEKDQGLIEITEQTSGSSHRGTGESEYLYMYSHSEEDFQTTRRGLTEDVEKTLRRLAAKKTFRRFEEDLQKTLRRLAAKKTSRRHEDDF